MFLIRTGKDKVRAFQVLCPHAGCPIEFHPDKSRPDTGISLAPVTPIPSSTWPAGGSTSDRRSPRDLDELEVRIGPRGEVLVQYEKFRTGTAEKIAVP